MTRVLRENWQDRRDACAAQWGLTSIEFLSDVSTARVAFCNSPLGPAVLKVALEPGMVSFEARALAHFGSEMCPQVFAVDPGLDSLLLERIEVSERLSDLYPAPEKEIAVWLPFFRAVEGNAEVPDGFPTLSKYAEVFDRMLGLSQPKVLADLLTHAREHQEMLIADEGKNRLLHGDMHHFNLLKDASGRWRLIDPHGVVGHPLYELGAFLRNPWGACYVEPGVRQRLVERIAILSDQLAIPTSTVAMYGFYGAAFSIAWTLEDEGGDVEGMVVMADALLRMVD